MVLELWNKKRMWSHGVKIKWVIVCMEVEADSQTPLILSGKSSFSVGDNTG